MTWQIRNVYDLKQNKHRHYYLQNAFQNFVRLCPGHLRGGCDGGFSGGVGPRVDEVPGNTVAQ